MIFQRRETVFISVGKIGTAPKSLASRRNRRQINFSSLEGERFPPRQAASFRALGGYRYFNNAPLSTSPRFRVQLPFLSLIVVSRWRPLESVVKSTRNVCTSRESTGTWSTEKERERERERGYKVSLRLIVYLSFSHHSIGNCFDKLGADRFFFVTYHSLAPLSRIRPFV